MCDDHRTSRRRITQSAIDTGGAEVFTKMLHRTMSSPSGALCICHELLHCALSTCQDIDSHVILGCMINARAM